VLLLLKTPPLPNVGDGECVALVEHCAKLGRSKTWKEGALVRGNLALREGTAIATFVGGRYPDTPHGDHAALYLSQDATGIWVVDQYRSSNGIRKRHLRFKGRTANGFRDPSNNGDAFSVIE